MTSLDLSKRRLFHRGAAPEDRPTGVTAIAVASLLLASLYFAFAFLVWTGTVSFTQGTFLLDGDLASRGPLIFLIFGFLFARVGFGLLRMSRWSRYLAILLAALGIYVLVPPISAAAAEMRMYALATNGLQIMARAAVIAYLLQPSLAEIFNGDRHASSSSHVA